MKWRLISARFKFEPRDLWTGIFWDYEPQWLCMGRERFDLYVCLIPMLPLCLEFVRN